MTGTALLHTGPVSDSDLAEVQHRAALTVTEHAQDAEDARELLAMLGLLDRSLSPRRKSQLSPTKIISDILFEVSFTRRKGWGTPVSCRTCRQAKPKQIPRMQTSTCSPSESKRQSTRSKPVPQTLR